jgi:hypothetical protein
VASCTYKSAIAAAASAAVPDAVSGGDDVEDAAGGEVEEVDGEEADIKGGDADVEAAGTCGSAGTAIAQCWAAVRPETRAAPSADGVTYFSTRKKKNIFRNGSQEKKGKEKENVRGTRENDKEKMKEKMQHNKRRNKRTNAPFSVSSIFLSAPVRACKLCPVSRFFASSAWRRLKTWSSEWQQRVRRERGAR